MSNTTDEPALPHQPGGAQGQMHPLHGSVPTGGSGDILPARGNPAVVQLIVAGVFTLFGCFLAFPAVILGILAVVQQHESPSRSARFTRWGWIAFATGVGLTAIAGVGLMLIAGYAASGNN